MACQKNLMPRSNKRYSKGFIIKTYKVITSVAWDVAGHRLKVSKKILRESL